MYPACPSVRRGLLFTSNSHHVFFAVFPKIRKLDKNGEFKYACNERASYLLDGLTALDTSMRGNKSLRRAVDERLFPHIVGNATLASRGDSGGPSVPPKHIKQL